MDVAEEGFCNGVVVQEEELLEGWEDEDGERDREKEDHREGQEVTRVRFYYAF